MISILQRRSTRRHLRAAVILAMLPLAVLSALPLAAGCICADGHYEPICRAGQCQSGMSGCGCPCCRHHACCTAKLCCHRSKTNSSNQIPGEQFSDSGCCTPLVHQATPTIVNTSAVVDSEHATALVVAPIALPQFGEALKFGQTVDFDTGRPPNDLVITLQRLII